MMKRMSKSAPLAKWNAATCTIKEMETKLASTKDEAEKEVRGCNTSNRGGAKKGVFENYPYTCLTPLR
jgi:hypothetical protein